MKRNQGLFNTNISRKPEYSLNENLIDELIMIYGIKCIWLFSEKKNIDTVFRDFSHMKVTPGASKEVMLMPVEMEDWDGDILYNNFGLYNKHTQNLFISKASLLELYPDFLTEQGPRSQIVNSLLVFPSGAIMEVTHLESYVPGLNNLWSYADNPSSYRLTVKAYDNNLADEGTEDIEETVSFDEGENAEIFEKDETFNTHQLDEFFKELEDQKEEQDTEAEPLSRSGGPFGNLG